MGNSIFNNISVILCWCFFIGGENQTIERKPLTSMQIIAKLIASSSMEYTLSQVELILINFNAIGH
jgi:hypothetical protein